MHTRISTSRPPHLLVQLFLATREERNCEPRTLADYAEALGRFFDTPGVPDDPRLLESEHVILFLSHLRRSGTGAGGRAALQRRVNVFLNWLYRMGKVDRNPGDGVDKVLVPRQLLPQVDLATMTALIAQAEWRGRTKQGNLINNEHRYRNVAILRLFWATGLRRGELCALRLEDVDFDQRLLLVRYAKGKKQRRVPFDIAAKQAILMYIAEERGDTLGPLFRARTGGFLTPNGLTQTVVRLAARAGVTAPTHAFRRGFARRMRREGLDLGETATLMGHSQLVMTQRYSQEGEAEAALAAYRAKIG